MEKLVRETVSPKTPGHDRVNIGSTPDYSAIYTTNPGMHTATVQVSLKEDHKVGSYEYMARVRKKVAQELPEITAYFQSGGLVDAVLSLGMPAPIDVQVSGSNPETSYATALTLARQIRKIDGVGDIFVPQDIDYPALQLDVDRMRARELGLTQKEVVGNIITALTSNAMIAPSFWIDSKTGNDYMLTVQYPERQIQSFDDLRAISPTARASRNRRGWTRWPASGESSRPPKWITIKLRRVIDIYVQPLGEDLGRIASSIDKLTADNPRPVASRCSCETGGGMAEFPALRDRPHALVVLLYLILVAQFRSFRTCC